MDLSDKKVLVTGGSGFIGSHLVERLVSLGADVTCFVKYNSMNRWGWLDTFDEKAKDRNRILSGDRKDADAVRCAVKGQDIVFHLGALIAIPYSYVNPRDVVQTNVMGTFNVLSACREENCERIIHTSTSEVYGTPKTVPIKETHPLQGQSPYSASKIAADKIAESFHLAFDMPIATIRPVNTYGERQSARAIIPTIITQALTKDIITIGNYKPTRDFNYVTDTVEGFLAVAQSKKAIGETINIGTGKEISIKELANIFGSEINLSRFEV